MKRPFFPWQRYVADVALEVLPDGAPAYTSVLIEVQRRGGKTVLIAPLTAHRSGRAVGAESTWMTAQKRKSAVRRWADAARVIRDVFPTSALRHIVSNDHETLQWKQTGAEFLPFSPDETSMHGEEPGLVFVDELWSFSLQDRAEIQASYRPAWSVRSGQEWKLSAAGTLDSGWLKADREEGRRAVEAGQRQGVAFFRWCVPEEVEGIPIRRLPDDVVLAAIEANHPRAGRGLRMAYVAEELKRDRDDAIRAYGGLDNTASLGRAPIDMEALEHARVTPAGVIPADAGRLSLGVSVDPASRESSIAVAWSGPDGDVVEAVATRPGTLWLRGAVARILEESSVGVVVTGPESREAADSLTKGEDPPVLGAGEWGGSLAVTAGDWLGACRRFRDRIEQREPGTPPLRIHDERETEPLVGAIRAADLRQTRAGLEWVPRAIDVPITALQAGTAAAWGLDHMPEPPAQRIPLVIR